MATALRSVKLPPIVFIEPPNGSSSYFHEPMYRIFGLFSVKNAEGGIKGTLELGGNFAMFHTCCGGARFSALRADYRQRDTWYGDSQYVERYHTIAGVDSSFLTWNYIRDNPDELPSVNELAGQDNVHTWSHEQIKAWGQAVLVVHLKSMMQSFRRPMALGIDRTMGKSHETLKRLANVAGLLYPMPLSASVYSSNTGARSYARGGACSHATSSLIGYFRNSYRQDNTRLFANMCAYGAPVVHNINSGNELVNLMVAPEMAPDSRRSKNVKLMRPHAKPFEFELYTAATPELTKLFDFYNSVFFKRVVPDRPSVA